VTFKTIVDRCLSRPARDVVRPKEDLMNRLTGGRLALAVVLAASGIALIGSPASAGSVYPQIRLMKSSMFDTSVELQGIYDEMSQVYVPAMTAEDVRLFDRVVYTPDWVFIDASGRQHTQAQMSARAAEAPEPDFLVQRIESLAPTPGGVTAMVTVTSVYSPLDTAGRYGVSAASHTTTDVTSYSDSWVRTPDGWKMKSRVQTGPTRTILNQPEWGM
jgi:hypothetical protein